MEIKAAAGVGWSRCVCVVWWWWLGRREQRVWEGRQRYGGAADGARVISNGRCGSSRGGACSGVLQGGAVVVGTGNGGSRWVQRGSGSPQAVWAGNVRQAGKGWWGSWQVAGAVL